MKRIVHAHDTFFRTVMSDPRLAREFFSIHLPADLLAQIDLAQLTLQPESHIDELRKKSTVDLLFKTEIYQHPAYIYLLVEHQSTPDELMPFRMLKYTCNVIEYHLKNNESNKIPLVYPMVVYHAKRPYPFSNNIADLVNAPTSLVDQYFLKPFHLIDLGCLPDEEIKQHAWIGITEFILKHIFERDIFPYLRDIASLMRQIAQYGGEDYISIVLQYALERGELKNQKAFFDLVQTEISSEIGAEVMTLAEQLRQEGRIKGWTEGKMEGKMEGKIEGQREGRIAGKIEGHAEGKKEARLEMARKLLTQHFDMAMIIKITGLSEDEILQCKEQA